MNTSKKTMLAAALAVAVVALAGVGYALSYTATTTNGGNSLDAKYVTLSQEGNAYTTDILTNLYYDTVQTSATAFDYLPVSTHTFASNQFSPIGDTHSNTGYALISQAITLTVNAKNSNATAGSLVVNATGLDVGGLNITMVLGKASTTTTGAIDVSESKAITLTSGSGSWNFGELTFANAPTVDSTNKTYSWEVYLFASGTSTTPISAVSAASFEFVLTMDATSS